jgi:hypothetical protein
MSQMHLERIQKSGAYARRNQRSGPSAPLIKSPNPRRRGL